MAADIVGCTSGICRLENPGEKSWPPEYLGGQLSAIVIAVERLCVVDQIFEHPTFF